MMESWKLVGPEDLFLNIGLDFSIGLMTYLLPISSRIKLLVRCWKCARFFLDFIIAVVFFRHNYT